MISIQNTTCSSSVLDVSSGIVSGNSLSFPSLPICTYPLIKNGWKSESHQKRGNISLLLTSTSSRDRASPMSLSRSIDPVVPKTLYQLDHDLLLDKRILPMKTSLNVTVSLARIGAGRLVAGTTGTWGPRLVFLRIVLHFFGRTGAVKHCALGCR